MATTMPPITSSSRDSALVVDHDGHGNTSAVGPSHHRWVGVIPDKITFLHDCLPSCTRLPTLTSPKGGEEIDFP